MGATEELEMEALNLPSTKTSSCGLAFAKVFSEETEMVRTSSKKEMACATPTICMHIYTHKMYCISFYIYIDLTTYTHI